MLNAEIREEYNKAVKAGLKEVKDRAAKNLDPGPAVLDELIDTGTLQVVELPLVEIPVRRVVGVKSAGRISAFSAGFMPILGSDTEFAGKWMTLCAAHLGDTGIRDPIQVFEYLGNFYVQEGNKRLSVMKHFGAVSIPAHVKRLLPEPSEEPRIRAYYEFLDFYKLSGSYELQYTRPGSYSKLLARLGREPGVVWTEDERRSFQSGLYYLRDALEGKATLEDALLLWLEVHKFKEISTLSTSELSKAVAALRDDIEPKKSLTLDAPKTEVSRGILGTLIHNRSHLNVAFVHQSDVSASLWTRAHEAGRQYLSEALGDKVTARSYFNADDPDTAAQLLERAIADGADAVFTTTPTLLRPTLRAAVKYPKVKFLNCSADIPFSSVRGYYFRDYEGKFIAGALAGAMAREGRLGYIAAYPILGVPAAINAFALGAQLTNPEAQVVLRWSCQPGNHTLDLMKEGVKVICDRDVPTLEKKYLDYGCFGTFLTSTGGALTPLVSPCLLWGTFYEKAVRSLLVGALDEGKEKDEAVSYWLGMDSGVIDVTFSEALPAGVRALGDLLRKALTDGALDPFAREVRAQDGSLLCDGITHLTAEQILKMDKLCDSVIGAIPAFEELRPLSRETVRLLGIYKDSIPPEKEVNP
ncbi:MAG: BMP family ABC transporter substrate-binding protein [bacterium]